MKKHLIFALFVFSVNLYSQGIFKVETDKSVYDYGEPIVVTVRLYNDTDTSFSVWGSTSGLVDLRLDTIYLAGAITTDYSEFPLLPGTERIWKWKIDPVTQGLPNFEGDHFIKAKIGHRIDSIKIDAPKYLGGQVYVGLDFNYSVEEVQALRDSINATVISSDSLHNLEIITEFWQITGYSIDSLKTALKDDHRIRAIDIMREADLIEWYYTSIDDEVTIPESYKLFQNYPNPFNPSTYISFNIPIGNNVKIEIFDIVGNKICELFKGFVKAGNHTLKFDAANLTSGVYIYTIRTSNFFKAKKMLLIK